MPTPAIIGSAKPTTAGPPQIATGTSAAGAVKNRQLRSTLLLPDSSSHYLLEKISRSSD